MGDGRTCCTPTSAGRAGTRPRRCCSATPAAQDSPRILGAFNEETPDWLSFFMFTYFTDRDGKYQLGTLKESAFDPLSRTCEFMLKEEAHHMFVGTTGVDRVVERDGRAHDASTTPTTSRPCGGIPLAVIQKYLNFHYSVVARPVRRRDLHQRGELLHRRAEGALAWRSAARTTTCSPGG